ncbi:MAG: hypothetical protein KGQ88_07505, partial [Chloroflexi bacterium]|nr:hypothetical protein [Chloroflexota bacterium]
MRRHSPRLRDLALTAVMAVSLTVVPPPRPVAAGTAASMYGSCGTDFSETVTDGTATFYWRLLGGRGAYGSVYLAPAGTFAWTDVWNAYMTPGVWTTVSFSVAGYRDGYYDIGLHAPGYNDHCISRAVYVRNVPTAPYPVTVSPSSSTTDTFTFSWGASHDSFGIAYYEYGWASIYPRGTTTATSVTLSGGDPGPGTYTFCARAVNTQGDRSAWGCASYIYSSYRTVFTAFSWSGPIVAGCPATATATLAYVDASGREVPLAGESVVFAFELPFGSPGVPGLRLGQGWTDGTGTATVSGLVPSAGAGFFSLGPSTVYALFGGDRAYRYARASATVLILPDSSPPTVPDVTSVPVASTTNDFTASWPASVSACGVRSYRYRIDGGAISSVSGTSVSGPLAPSQGTHEIEVAAADRDGLISAWSAPASFTYALPPSVPLVTVAPAVSATNSFAASWSASTSALGVSYYRYRVDGGPASSTTSTSVRGPLAPSLGTHEIEVSAVDSAGNVSAWSVPTSFTYTSPPSVPVVTVTPATSTTDSFTASWPASTSSVGVAYYRYQIDGGPVSITTKASVA